MNTNHAEESLPIVYFDGVCGLCNRFVDVVMRWDKTAVLRFAPIQGVTASGRLGERDNDPEKWSIVYEDENRMYERSEAVLRILMRLGWPFMLAGVLLIVPGFIRDVVYRVVARNRYRWFGRRDTCRLPTPAERARFLD